MEAKEFTNHFPSQNFGPCSQNYCQGDRKWAITLSPGDSLYFDATVCACYPPGCINQNDRNSSKGNMFPMPLFQCVVPRSFGTATWTDKSAPPIRDQVNNHFSMFFSNLFHTMSLESKGLSYYTFNEHESYPPFLSVVHQQEVLDLIHAFKLLNENSTHKFVWGTSFLNPTNKRLFKNQFPFRFDARILASRNKRPYRKSWERK